MLTANDELRHPAGDNPAWRESVYFNFADPKSGIGAWIYLWVLPNQKLKSGMLCSFYRGLHPDPGTPERAQSQPGHIEHGPGGSFMYYVAKNMPELVAGDFDDVTVNGLHLRRTAPLSSYRLEYADDAGNGFELDCDFLAPPYDYASHPFETPPWFATNRYHRPWRCRGELRVGGERFDIDTTGDSDHSWGARDRSEIQKYRFKMWSAQAANGIAFSVITMGPAGNELPRGFVLRDGTLRHVVRVREETEYGADGVEREGQVELTDDTGEQLRTSFRMFASIPVGAAPAFWGHEGAATYEIAGAGPTSGIASYFWPGSILPADLHPRGPR